MSRWRLAPQNINLIGQENIHPVDMGKINAFYNTI